jgi:hypothetical protein
MIDDALALFPREQGERAAAPMPDGLYGALGTKWTKYGGVHKPCEYCVQLIHHGGGRHPEPARWRRKGPNDERLLCNDHGEQQRRLDDKVTQEVKDAVEARYKAQQAAISARRRRAADS